MQKITPHLWFDHEAEEAAKFYVATFRNSKIGTISRYGEEGQEITGQVPGTVMTVQFQIEGQDFMALNGGSLFKFNEAISFMVSCENQQEVDELWERLSAVPASEQCGWLKDKFGVSWQIIPKVLGEMMADPDPKKSERVMKALLPMKKIDIAALERAYKQ